MEAYIDDMLAKYMTEQDHLVNLEKIFEWLRKYDLKLKSNKRVFCATYGKLSVFIVSQCKLRLTYQPYQHQK